ncbi:MAG: nitrate reductase [Phycisphaeraceae bacterium]|nr:MAG: nitrate reductase [Phycisphaeraceae bacterium]
MALETQVVHPLTHSQMSLTNSDLAPVAPHDRTWSTWNIAALWIAMAVCIPTYTLAASMISAGMAWWQAVLTVMLGNLIVLVPMILNGHGGTKYGVPFPVLARASFGTAGAHIPAVARALVACGWFGIQTWIGGWAIYQILGALGWLSIADDTTVIPFLDITGAQLLCFLAFWAMNVAIVVSGVNLIKWVEAWAAPFLLLSGVALLIWAMSRVDDVGALFAQASQFESDRQFWAVFFPQLTAMVGFWATLSLNIPDFTRYCRTQKEQALGQALGLPATMTLFCFIGVMVTSATVILFGEAIWDPVALVPMLGTPMVVVIALVALTIATLSTNIAANVVSPANGFSNLAPGRIGFRTGAMITCLIGILIMPWRLYNDLGAYIFTWLIGYSALLGPIAGIMLCDYFILRRTRLDVNGLYDAEGPYRGVNRRAVAALLIAVAPNVPGFVNAATGRGVFPGFFDQIYQYAWFVGIGLAILVYYLLMRGRAVPARPERGVPIAESTPEQSS